MREQGWLCFSMIDGNMTNKLAVMKVGIERKGGKKITWVSRASLRHYNPQVGSGFGENKKKKEIFRVDRMLSR